jgi:hypothetical protein
VEMGATLNGMGRVMVCQGRYQDAIEKLDKALKTWAVQSGS